MLSFLPCFPTLLKVARLPASGGTADRQWTEWGLGQGLTQAGSAWDAKGGGGWARGPDLSSLLILIPFHFRMERAAGDRGRDPWGQPGPWELQVGLLLSGKRFC